MKKLIFLLFLAIKIMAQPTMTELVSPLYVGGNSYSYANSMATAYQVKISGLTALTTYKFAAGMISVDDISVTGFNQYGVGYYYFPEYDTGGILKISTGQDNSKSAQFAMKSSTDIMTNAAGEITTWVIICPINNYRFQYSSAYLCLIHNNGDGTDNTSRSNRIISSLSSLTSGEFSSPWANDCAFIQGQSLAPGGKYIFIYSQENPGPTDRPLHGYLVENNVIDENSGESFTPSFYSTNISGTTGNYGLVVPVKNSNGIRRIETFNSDGTSYGVATDADGIWPSGLNTTALTAGTVYNITAADAPLPVELQEFTANLSNNKVALNWKTATEVNSYMFEVQKKSAEITDWLKIGSVPGSGNSNSTKNYSFTDINPRPGVNYYRLKMIDNDGSFELSEEKAISLEAPSLFSINQNYPNPFNPITKISFDLPRTAFVTLEIYDLLGKEVAELINGSKSAGSHQIDFDGSKLSSGTYIYKLSADGLSEVKKMILIK